MAGSIKVAGHELVSHDIANDKLVYGTGVPAGTVIRVLAFSSSTAVSNEIDQFIPIDSTNTSIQIPNYTYGNKLLIYAAVHVKVQENSGLVQCSGYYKTSGALGSPAIPTTSGFTTTGLIGYRRTSINTINTSDHDTLTMLDIIELTGSGTTHLDYAIYTEFGGDQSHLHPYPKRLFIQEIQG